MSSEASLGETVTNAVNAWCVENGGGFPLGFIIALDYVNEDGKAMLAISKMDEQPIHRSLGLSTYLDAWFRDDAQISWQTMWAEDGDD